MVRRGGCVVVLLALGMSSAGPAASAHATPRDAFENDVVITGTGTAHGLGMAMDGVEAQARAGWTDDRILSLFYPDTVTGRATGTIRVGLADAPSVALSLPNGGTISDAPRGRPASAGFPVTLAAGAPISLRAGRGGIAMTLPTRKTSAANATQAPPSPKPRPGAADAAAVPTPRPRLFPTAPPILQPTPGPTARPSPASPGPAPGGARTTTAGPAPRHLWIWGTGDPALVGVGATGRRYRGSIEVVVHPSGQGGSLTVVNHVDLETYVAGIAEEKGAGWPIEALKALAIAARTLGAATMSWYERNQANGYDICPTDKCQVYLGFDGEEPSMRRATAETAGQIRTYNGRPILAMYHGNGGGQTETYKRLITGGGDPHPYLRSVKYPFADPYHWKRKTNLATIDASLRAAGVAVPGALQGMDVIERGDSPRVVRLRLRGADGETTITGQRFADALDLWSTWFDIGSSRSTAVVSLATGDAGYPLAAEATEPLSAAEPSWAALFVAMIALAALAAATAAVIARDLGLPVLGWVGGVRGALLYGSDVAG